MKCEICPRQCKIERENKKGFCGQTEKIKISKVMFHHYEEPLISGDENAKGSGAIFFAGCNLKCAFCQNYPISHQNKGKYISIKKYKRFHNFFIVFFNRVEKILFFPLTPPPRAVRQWAVQFISLNSS